MLEKPKFLTGEVKEFIDLELKNIPVRLYSLEQVKRNKKLLLTFNKVRIWSVEHQQYWRPNSRGYTGDRELSGVYEFPDAFERTKHCDESKGIIFEEVFNIKDFYNQPFDTAMIEKYFKGWVKTKDLSFIVMNGNNRILIGKKAIYEDQGMDVFAENYLFPKPRTLNHFISDCIRAGINLEWRE